MLHLSTQVLINLKEIYHTALKILLWQTVMSAKLTTKALIIQSICNQVMLFDKILLSFVTYYKNSSTNCT